MNLSEGDLIFLITDGTPMSKAICASSESRIDHVGILTYNLTDSPTVIEARPGHGVVATPIDLFILRGKGHIVGRVDMSVNLLAEATRRAASYLGLPYNATFKNQMPGREPDSLYCSQLVYFCFRDAQGNTVFEQSPMNFNTSDTETSLFWEDYFLKENAGIPQGEPGTSPYSILSALSCRRTYD